MVGKAVTGGWKSGWVALWRACGWGPLGRQHHFAGLIVSPEGAQSTSILGTTDTEQHSMWTARFASGCAVVLCCP